MTLLFEERHPDQGPSTHALIVGVSAYRHLPGGGSGALAPETFGMHSPSSAATTAYGLYEQVTRITFAAPLATCRVLLSPTPTELEREPRLADAEDATMAAFMAEAERWRRDAAARRDNIALLYLVGLGLERSLADQVFLLANFGDGDGPLFRNSVSFSSIYAGMAPSESQSDIARTQLMVFDASRVGLPQEYDLQWSNATPVFAAAPTVPDDRATLTMFSAPAGGEAFARKRSGSVFGQAFARCLDGAAATLTTTDGDARWAITTHSLVEGLQAQAELMSETIGRRVSFSFGGSVNESVIAYVNRPEVDVEIRISPPAAAAVASFELTDEDDAVVWSWGPWSPGEPVTARVPAGIYRLTTHLKDAPPGLVAPRDRWRHVTPPRTRWSLDFDAGA